MAPITETASAMLASILPSSLIPTSNYLLPMPASPALDSRVATELQAIEREFSLDGDLLHRTVQQMLWEYRKGLAEHTTDANRDTFLPMIPTYIHNVPDGTETGTFLALDLGGTNLRVCEVQLLGDSKFTMRQEKFKVSDALKTGAATDLFDYIAESVGNFMSSMEKTDSRGSEQIYLGFTFSFPVEQTALDKGTLINWTKGFTAHGAAGKDVVQLLQDALDRKKVPVRCSALVNDTVGTLLSRAYQSGAALVGGIFGTGTNGAYLEKMSAITKPLPTAVDFDYMIVNTEWGAFDNERQVLKITPYDNKCDRESINPRKQAFEKMVSGMYIGEIVRNVLIHLVDRNLLFNGHSSPLLNTHYGLDTALMSAIEEHPLSAYSKGAVTDAAAPEEWAQGMQTTRKVLTETLQIPDKHVSEQDCLVVRRVCEIVGTRGARLAAVAVAATLIQTGHDVKAAGTGTYDELHVGVDGSLVEFYPGFEVRLRAALRDVVDQEREERVRIGLAKDGSGIGAALTALQAKKQQEALEQTGQSTKAALVN